MNIENVMLESQIPDKGFVCGEIEAIAVGLALESIALGKFLCWCIHQVRRHHNRHVYRCNLLAWILFVEIYSWVNHKRNNSCRLGNHHA
jgi:hypothetical protein